MILDGCPLLTGNSIQLFCIQGQYSHTAYQLYKYCMLLYALSSVTCLLFFFVHFYVFICKTDPTVTLQLTTPCSSTLALLHCTINVCYYTKHNMERERDLFGVFCLSHKYSSIILKGYLEIFTPPWVENGKG